MAIELTDFEAGVSLLDSGFMRPRFTGIYLVVEDGHAAIVDTAVNAAVPLVQEALAAKGVEAGAVDLILLTHIHLDHAGGASQLMQLFPNARLVVHPRGARHMADPSKLWRATADLYGEEAAIRSYGQIVPIAADRITEAADGFKVDFRGRTFTCHDSPGHAKHHLVIRDSATGNVFSGDTCGLAYPELDRDGRRFVFPTTSPSQFDPDALHRSLDLIAGLGPEAVYATHYGRVGEVPRVVADLHRLVDGHAGAAREAAAAGATGVERHRLIKEGVTRLLLEERSRQGWALDDTRLLNVFAADRELNAQGLAVWLDSLNR